MVRIHHLPPLLNQIATEMPGNLSGQIKLPAYTTLTTIGVFGSFSGGKIIPASPHAGGAMGETGYQSGDFSAGVPDSDGGCQTRCYAGLALGVRKIIWLASTRAGAGLGAVCGRVPSAGFELLLLAHPQPQNPVPLAFP